MHLAGTIAEVLLQIAFKGLFMPKNLNLRFRVWVFANDTPYLGVGPVELLEKIIQHGSISKAAAAMKMSYRKAWAIGPNNR